MSLTTGWNNMLGEVEDETVEVVSEVYWTF
jgi:hypothetical protein